MKKVGVGSCCVSKLSGIFKQQVMPTPKESAHCLSNGVESSRRKVQKMGLNTPGVPSQEGLPSRRRPLQFKVGRQSQRISGG